MDWRQVLGAVAILSVIGEVISAFFHRGAARRGLTYEREDADDWILQIAFLILGGVGVIAAAIILWRHFRGPRPASA
jgi:hypothetical protein